MQIIRLKETMFVKRREVNFIEEYVFEYTYYLSLFTSPVSVANRIEKL